MRIKNFTLLFLMGIFGMFSLNLHAQQDASIDPADIHYWIGEGQNEAILAVNWAEPNVCYAWGYRFDGETATVKDMMDAIAAADTRFDYQGGGGMVMEITFTTELEQLGLVGPYWMYNVNGGMAWYGYDEQTIVNGDFVKFGDIDCATEIAQWTYVWETEVTALYPYAVEATIDPADIHYWIGEGQNEAILAVNWAEPNVCYAWGYRFDGETATVKDMLDAIAAADTRFDYQGGGGMVTDITFNTEEEHLALVGPYWMYNINGGMAWYGYDEQTLMSGDFVKFGDISCATEIGQWTYVWECPVQPVVNNTGVEENQLTMSLYPNPASSYTLLDVQIQNQATVTITDLQGRLLDSFVMDQNSEPIRIETSSYEAGVYFVTISDASYRQTMKLVVK